MAEYIAFRYRLFGRGNIERDEPVWDPSLIYFVICRQKYVEKEIKLACGRIDNPNIANADSVSSIFGREPWWWTWYPKRGSSFLDQKVFIIDLRV